MAAYVALLRGINVGGKNKLPMRDLVAMFNDVGCEDVRTYIQSGNVIFTAPAETVKTLPETVTKAINAQFGYRTSVVVRSTKQLAEVVVRNPFLRQGAPEEMLHVLFLATRPGTERVELLDPDRSPGDEFAVQGTEVYLNLPNGAARTKLTNGYFDSKLATVSTQRNWCTVNKLLDLMHE